MTSAITSGSKITYMNYQDNSIDPLRKMITFAKQEKNAADKNLLLNAIYKRFSVIPEALRNPSLKVEFSRLVIAYAETVNPKKSVLLLEFALCQLVNLLDLGALCPDWPTQESLEELTINLECNQNFSLYWNSLPISPDCLGIYARDRRLDTLINKALIQLKSAYSKFEILDEKNDEILMRLRKMIEGTKAKL